MASQATSTAAQTANKYENYIDNQLEKTRARIKMVDLCTGLFALVGWVLGVLLFFAIVDGWIWTLGTFGRTAALLVLVSGVLAISLFYVLPLFLRKINPNYAARMIEQARPKFKNSILNYLWLKAGGQNINASVASELSQQAAEDISEVSATESVDQSNLIRSGFIVVGLAVLTIGYSALSPKSPLPTVARVMNPFSDVAKPAMVRVTSVEPGDVEIYFGDSLMVTAEIRGRHEPHDVQLVYSTEDGQHTDVVRPMAATGPRRYETELRTSEAGIQQNLRYKVVAKDGESRWYDVHVKPLPAVSIQSLKLVPPKYTELSERTITGTGEVNGVEGTRVFIDALANLPVKNAYLEFLSPASKNNPDDLRVVKTTELEFEERKISGNFLLTLNAERNQPFCTHYQIRYQSTQGDLNSKPNLYPVRITPDLSPELLVIEPRNNEVLVPSNGSLKIQIEATDVDYEISSMNLQIDNKGVRVLNHLFELPAGDKHRVQQSYWLVPEKLSLKPGDRATFFAFASDNRHSPYSELLDPNVTRTDDFTIIITEPDEQIDEQRRDEDIEQAEQEQKDQNQNNGKNSKDDRPENDPNDGSEQNPDEQPESDQGEQNNNDQDSEQNNEDQNTEDGQESNPNPTQSEQEQKDSASDKGSNSEDNQNQAGDDEGKGEQEQKDGDSQSDSQQQSTSDQQSNSENQSDAGSGDSKSDQQPQDGTGNSNSKGDQSSQQQKGSGNEASEPSQQAESSNNSQANNGNPNDGEMSDPRSGDNNDGQRSDGEGEGSRDENLRDGEMSEETPVGERMEDMMEYFNEKNKEKPDSGNGQESDNQTGETSDDASGDETGEPKDDPTGQDPDGQKSDEGKGQGANNENDPEKAPKGEQKGNPGNSGDDSEQQQESDRDSGSQSDSSDGDPKNEQNSNRESSAQNESNDPKENQESSGNSNSENDSGDGSNDPPGDESNGDEQEGDGPKTSEQKGSSGDEQKSGDNGESSDEKGSSENQSDDESEGNTESEDKQSQGGSDKGNGDSPSGEGDSNQDNDSPADKSQSGSGGSKGSDGNVSNFGGEADEKTFDPQGNPNAPVQSDRDFERAKREKENLEYTKKATDLLLENLREQAKNPDPEFLERNNWTPEELMEFIKSWEKMRDAAKKGGAREKRLYESRLKSLGLKPQGVQEREVQGERDEQFGLSEDGAINRPSADWSERYNRYMKQRNKVDR